MEPTPTTYLAALFRLLGSLNVILGFVGLLLLQRYRSDRQTWILRLVVVLSLLAYVGPIVFDNTVGTIGFFEIVEHVLFALMVLSGAMMLRARDVRQSP
jgi:peptidoglycan/LPS O-acetylase OafA/YrhL